jgi:hypothetical protein
MPKRQPLETTSQLGQASKYLTEFSLHRFEHRNFSLDDFEDACCDWTVAVSGFGGGVLRDSWGLSDHAGARGRGLWSLRFESCRNLNLNF